MASTKKSLTARVAAGIGAVALATLTAFAGALPASAAANIDPTVPASITIHTHEQTGVTGTAGTGSATDSVAGAAIPGVQFSIRAVTSLDVHDNVTWAELRTLTAADVAEADLGATDGLNSWMVTTAANGTITQGLPQGVYLVEELTAPAGAGVVIASQPFLVVVPQAVEATGAWNYNVHVFPKNTVSDVIKTVEPFEQELLPAAVTWALDAGVPVPVDGTDLESFVVVDTLDQRVAHDLADLTAVRVVVDSVALSRGTDFTVGRAGDQLSVTFLQPGLDALLDHPDTRVLIDVDTTVTTLGDGTIPNLAHAVVNGVSTEAGSDVAHFGNVEFLKVDQNGDALVGATFELRDSTGAVLATQESDVDGNVRFAGIRTTVAGESYTVVETAAPSGYMLGTVTSWPVTVPVGETAALEIAEPVVNAQVPAYALPVTGGSGQAAFMIGGAGLLLGALGFMLIRRRKAQADA